MEERLRFAFIQKCITDYLSAVKAAMERDIIRQNAIETGKLLHSISYRAYQQDAAGNGSLSFPEWGRYIDMGVDKFHPLSGGPIQTFRFLQSRRKPKKVYSPIAYGKLNGLIGDLSYGFTEETIQKLKQDLGHAAE